MNVRRFIGAALSSLTFSLASGYSNAAWVTLYGANTNWSYMVEDQAIKKIGAKVSFWYIVNFVPKPGDESAGKSGVVNYEGDCEKRTLSVVYMRMHKDSMGKGEVTLVNDMPFQANVGKAEQQLLDYVCSKY